MKGLARLVPAVLAAVLLLAGCTTPTGEPRPLIPWNPPRDTNGQVPEHPVWFAGDSIAEWTARVMPSAPYTSAQWGAAYTAVPLSERGTILGNTLEDLAGIYTPSVMLVAGGGNDAFFGQVSPSTIIPKMVEFEQVMNDLGIAVVFVLEPDYYLSGPVRYLSQWLLENRTNIIDCRAVAGVTWDGLHPADYTDFANCVDDRLAAMQLP